MRREGDGRKECVGKVEEEEGIEVEAGEEGGRCKGGVGGKGRGGGGG